MGESYVEQLVKKKDSPGQIGIRVGATAFAVLFTYALLNMIGIISLVAAFALGYGVYYVFMITSIEYEYTYVNGELTIDTIYGRNKRKTAGVYEVKRCEILAPVKSSAAAYYDKNQMKSFDFTSGDSDANVYLMVVPYGAGTAKLYFEPSEELVDAIRTIIPSKVKMQ